MEVFVARQAIFDRKRQLYAYELLYRSSAVRNQYDGTDAAAATRNVVSNMLLSMGLENILSGKKAFLNFGHSLLAAGHAFVLAAPGNRD
jgi:EAL and modified HD-GYP domain-containing signal transduction protein